MKVPINDSLVGEYVKRLRAGGPLGEVFPYPLSECDFTESQRQLIKQARAAREKLLKRTNPKPPEPAQQGKPIVTPAPVKPIPTPPQKTKTLSKLERMLYLQQDKCFFCDESLSIADANIEHLHPLSKGGTRTEDNEVVCHKSLNETFGNLPLKQKFEFVLKAAGSFKCPKK
jgi:hypothetical protein